MKTLSWITIRKIGKSDNANRWYPSAEIAPYFSHLRAPSRAFPHSYAKSAQTVKFAKWILATHPALAESLGLEK